MHRADNFCPDDSLVCGLPKNQLDNGSDEPMAPQNIPAGNSCVVSNTIACNSLKSFGLQFGAIPFVEKYNKNEEGNSVVPAYPQILFLLVQHC